MLENSKDILYVAIAISVLSLAGFTSWAIYYLARVLQQAFKMTKNMQERLAKIDELIKSIKDKVEHSTSYLLLIGEGVKKLVEVIKERTEKPKSKKDK